MMIMAQHPQQRDLQQQHVYQSGRQKANQAATTSSSAAEVVTQQYNAPSQSFQQTQIKAASNANGLLQHKQEQDGKRTLIKNQLYLIEQLQLENANLRNERDQLQLENEELKFQLQMISSSNILNQPGAAFNNQQLERLVETNQDGRIDGDHRNHTAANSRPTGSNTANNDNNQSVSSSTNQPHQQQVKLIVRPLKQQAIKYNDDSQQQRPILSATNEQQLAQVRSTPVATDGKRQSLEASMATTIIPLGSLIATASTATTHSAAKKFGSRSATLDEFNVNKVAATATAPAARSANLAPQSRDLPHDDEEQRVKMVELRYGGDSEQVQAAAIVIQRAFRKYQICKRFRAITEQLRHTHQSSSCSTVAAAAELKQDFKSTSHTTTNAKIAATEIPYVYGTTRAAAWESLSYAASRLAAAGAATQQTIATTTSSTPVSQLKQVASSQQQQQINQYGAPKSVLAPIQQSHSQPQPVCRPSVTSRMAQKQDPVVAAAINFQQLESIRKRQYRVGLNIFNKNPEKGVSFLVAHSFIDSSSPYLKTSTSYYNSNQLLFINKQHLMQQQQLLQSTSPTNIQNCQSCREEENLKRNVAHFLLHRKGLAKEKIGQYLGNLQSQFNQDVLGYYLQELDFYGLQIDLALRKFLSTFRLPGEAQKIERIVDRFAQRYVQCQQQPQQHQQQLTGTPSSKNVVQIHLLNPQPQQQQQQQLIHNNQQQTASSYRNNSILLSKDEIFILTFAIIMLNTDLHSPSLKPTSRMSAKQFVNNLRGVFKTQTINESDLIEIYEHVKANQIATTPDHVTHVMKVQQGLTVTNFQKKELPNLCVPHRRLVCFCRLFEVYDINKKERLGQHQREIFLFNDLLLVTKLARRVRANTTQLYTYRQSISLQGLYVQLFQSTHYNFGIRLCQRSNDETLIMFNARNELDQSRFVDDLGESIAEMDEMETIKANNIIETIHFKYLERLRRHAMMHNTTNYENVQPQSNNSQSAEENQPSRMLNIMDNCDNKTTTINIVKKQPLGLNEERQQRNRDDEASGPRTTNELMTAPTHSGRIQSKFSSMLNLSSVIGGKGDMDDSNDSNDKRNQTKGLRQNKPPAQQAQRTMDHQLGGNSGRSDQVGSGVQRRCSTSSVHSLDSGLFLSRDVSPNQSS